MTTLWWPGTKGKGAEMKYLSEFSANVRTAMELSVSHITSISSEATCTYSTSMPHVPALEGLHLVLTQFTFHGLVVGPWPLC